MKTKKELIELRNEVEALNRKLAELTEEELRLVIGGAGPFDIPGGNGSGIYSQPCNDTQYDIHVYKDTIRDDF